MMPRPLLFFVIYFTAAAALQLQGPVFEQTIPSSAVSASWKTRWQHPLDLVTDYASNSATTLFMLPMGLQTVVALNKTDGSTQWEWTIRLSLCRKAAHQKSGIHCVLEENTGYSNSTSILVAALRVLNRPDLDVMVFGLNATNGYFLWFTNLPNNGDSFHFAVHSAVVANTPNDGGNITALNVSSGQTLWSVKTPKCTKSLSLKTDEKIGAFIYWCDDVATAFASDSGRAIFQVTVGEQWSYSHAVSQILVVRGTTLQGLSATTGQPLWKQDIGKYQKFHLVGGMSNGNILAGWTPNSGSSDSYHLVSFSAIGTNLWQSELQSIKRGTSYSQRLWSTPNGFLWVANDRLHEFSARNGSVLHSEASGGTTLVHSADEHEAFTSSCQGTTCTVSAIQYQ